MSDTQAAQISGPLAPAFRARITASARHNSYAFSALLFVVLLVATLIQDGGNFGLTSQLAVAAPMVLAALASAPSIIGGGFDLSVSPLLFLGNCLYVAWLAPHGMGGAVSVPIVLGICCVTGLLSGVLIALLRVPPVVVTLAMYFALQGVDLLLAPNPVTLAGQGRWIYDLAGSAGPIPGALFTIGIPLVIWYALRFVPYLRLLYAVGSNDATAFSAGVNVVAIRIASYGLGGLFAGFGGLALTALVHSADASTTTQYALVGIAAVVLGGTALTGGRGGMAGVIFAAFSIYLLQNLLATYQVNSAWLLIIYGAILIVAVVIQGALVPETSVGGLRPSRMPLWQRSRRPVQGIVLSEPNAAAAPVAPDDSAPASARSARGWQAELTAALRQLQRVQQRFPLLQLLALAAVFVYGVITLPGLGSWISIRSILVLAALVGLASCGQTLLILMGGFDLGVAGFIVAGGLTVTSLVDVYHITFATALACGLGAAALLGAVAGYVCHRFKINPLVVTLAMGSVALGVVKVQISSQLAASPPQWVMRLAEPVTKTLGVPIPPSVAIWAGVIVLFAIVLHRTRVGRNLLATGANPRAADRALINTRRVWVVAFAFSAVTSALVGVLIAGFTGVVVDDGGDPYLFQSVVAVIVGGTVFGGPGDYTRTSIGALFLTVVVTVMVGHGIAPALQDVVYGGIILVVVAIYGRERRLRDRV